MMDVITGLGHGRGLEDSQEVERGGNQQEIKIKGLKGKTKMRVESSSEASTSEDNCSDNSSNSLGFKDGSEDILDKEFDSGK